MCISRPLRVCTGLDMLPCSQAQTDRFHSISAHVCTARRVHQMVRGPHRLRPRRHLRGVFVCFYGRMCAYLCVFIYVLVYICVCTCVCVCVCVYVYVCVCVCVGLCVLHVCMYVHHTNVCMNTYIYQFLCFWMYGLCISDVCMYVYMTFMNFYKMQPVCLPLPADLG